MKNKKLIIGLLLTGIIITVIAGVIWFLNQSTSIADVGSFETYSSGSSRSSSSWGSGRSSSSYDDDDDGGLIALLFWVILNPYIPGYIKIIIIAVIIVLIVAVMSSKNRKPRNIKPQYEQIRNNSIYDNGPDRSEIIIETIHKHDPNFNAEKFKSYAKDIFIKLQNAWTERDWEKIRAFESNELFEQHKAQLDGYIRNNQINVLDRICVNWVRMISYEKTGGKEIPTVTLNSRMGDYIIDATTKQVLRGNQYNEYTNTYVMQFVRTEGVLTPESGDQVNTTNCPNCGAPTKIMTSGRCEYCNSVITTTKHGWVLNNLERK